jgi:hypothetical protein
LLNRYPGPGEHSVLEQLRHEIAVEDNGIVQVVADALDVQIYIIHQEFVKNKRSTMTDGDMNLGIPYRDSASYIPWISRGSRNRRQMFLSVKNVDFGDRNVDIYKALKPYIRHPWEYRFTPRGYEDKLQPPNKVPTFNCERLRDPRFRLTANGLQELPSVTAGPNIPGPNRPDGPGRRGEGAPYAFFPPYHLPEITDDNQANSYLNMGSDPSSSESTDSDLDSGGNGVSDGGIGGNRDDGRNGYARGRPSTVLIQDSQEPSREGGSSSGRNRDDDRGEPSKEIIGEPIRNSQERDEGSHASREVVSFRVIVGHQCKLSPVHELVALEHLTKYQEEPATDQATSRYWERLCQIHIQVELILQAKMRQEVVRVRNRVTHYRPKA